MGCYNDTVIVINTQTKQLEDRVAKLVTIRGGKILLLREYGKDAYGLPGGRVEEHETVEAGLIREIREELTCAPINYRLFSEVSIPGWNQGEIYHFVYFVGELEGEIKPNSEIESHAWVSKADIINLAIKLHPHVVKTKILEDLIAKGIIN